MGRRQRYRFRYLPSDNVRTLAHIVGLKVAGAAGDVAAEPQGSDREMDLSPQVPRVRAVTATINLV